MQIPLDVVTLLDVELKKYVKRDIEESLIDEIDMKCDRKVNENGSIAKDDAYKVITSLYTPLLTHKDAVVILNSKREGEREVDYETFLKKTAHSYRIHHLALSVFSHEKNQKEYHSFTNSTDMKNHRIYPDVDVKLSNRSERKES